MTKHQFLALAYGLLAACTLSPGWHWQKPGASEADYARDVKICKIQNQAPIDGSVTQESVRRLHGCMEARGWQKTRD